MANKRQKQQQVSFRTTPDLKLRIQAAADTNGLTFNKEVNRRLELSLDAPDSRDQTHVPGLLAVATAMNAAGQTAGRLSSLSKDSGQDEEWWNDPYAFEQAVRAANRIFEALRPPGKIEAPPMLSGKAGKLDMSQLSENLGLSLANGVVMEIISDSPTTTTATTRAPKLRRDVGDDLITRLRAFSKGARSK